MAADDAASAVFAPLDAADAAATQEAPTVSAAPLPVFGDLSPEERLLVHPVVSSALGMGMGEVSIA